MGYQKLTPIIATGSSAPRYIGDRFADIVNLKDFGAVGDGETDDSTAWAAWNTALQSGGMPYIPAGDYLLGDETVHATQGHFCGHNSVGTNTQNNSGNDIFLANFNAELYVDAENGDDSNDGLTWGTALQTINKAFDVAKSHTDHLCRIHVAGGTYDNIYVSMHSYVIQLHGDVTISNRLGVYNNGFLVIENSTEDANNDYLLNVYAGSQAVALDIFSNGGLVLNVRTNVYAKSIGINLFANSFLRALKNVSVLVNDTTVSSCDAIRLLDHSMAVFDEYTTVGGDANNASAFYIYGNSSCFFNKGFSNYNETKSTGGKVVLNSVLNITDVVYLHTDTAGNSALLVYHQSTCNIDNLTSNSQIDGKGVATLTVASDNISLLRILAPSGITVSFGSPASTGMMLMSGGVSEIYLAGAGTFSFSGTYEYTCYAQCNGYIAIDPAPTLSGSPTAKKFYATRGGQINVYGSGVNRIPGSTAGQAVGSSMAYYA